MRTPAMMALAGLLATIVGCSGSPTQPDGQREITGSWEARFQGTVQGPGTQQTDTFVMELRQSGSNVTGSLRFSGLDVSAPVTGQVNGDSFVYTARTTLGPGCEAVVRADTTLDAAGSRFSGTQTQSTCEGTAVGQVSATRRP